MTRFSRTIDLIGEDAFARLKNAHVLIVGLGGVGGYVFENLVRSGIGRFTLVDDDTVNVTNINRQLLALDDTVGQFKTDAAKSRASKVNPDAEVNSLTIRYSADTAASIFSQKYDYCVDAFDSVKEKIHFIIMAKTCGYNVISALGAGNRLGAEFEVKDIFATSGDGLARAVRKDLRAAGVKDLKTVCAKSLPDTNFRPPASISYAPAIMGSLIASEVIRDLIQ